jgi:hypothetical protein
VIDGVSLFPDHQDPLQYYYMPVAPQLTCLTDEATGQRVPQIQLIKYRGKAGSGGFLNFDVNIGITPDKLGQLAGKLQSKAGLPDVPRLAPVLPVDGTVRLLLLGKQTGDASTTADPNAPPKFVLKIDQAAKPALYGDNQAAFSVALDAPGVTVLEQALQGEMTPIGIVYSLEYLALRPAYAVKLSVDWDRVQKHLDEHFGVDAIFFSADIDKAVDELIDNRAIVLEADTFVPEGEDDAVLGRRDQAINEARELITDAFFKPSIDPLQDKEDGWDKAEHIVNRASQLAVTGGWASAATFSYKKVDYTRIDRKSLDVNFSERTTVKRTIYPQGHLSGLCRFLMDEGFKLSDYILSVDIDDPYFERRKLNVISRANFEEDSIGSIAVRLQYGDTPRDVLLEASNARGNVEWASILEDGAMQRDVSAGYTVTFKNVDGAERPISVSAPARAIDVDNFEVNPRELYSIMSVPIVALSFPWDRYPQVQVELRYRDEAHGIRMEDTLLLDQAHASQVWKIFAQDPDLRQFEYKLTFRAADNRDIEGAWQASDEQQITIRDPRPSKRTLQIVPSLDWTWVDRAFVDVSYEDAGNDVYAEGSFEFNKDSAATRTFDVGLANPGARQVEYSVTILPKSPRPPIEVPRSVTLDRRIIVRSDMRGHRIIALRPAGDLAANGLQMLRVDLRYDDQDAGLTFEDSFTFRSADDRAAFEFDYVDDAKRRYEYMVTYVTLGGLTRASDWRTAAADTLVIPLG